MAAFPGPSWTLPGFSGPGDMTFESEGSLLTLHGNGTISLKGPVKIAALNLIKHITEEFSHGLIEINLNRVLLINFKGKIELRLVNVEEKPDFWDEFVQEFNKIVSMKIFW
jgi:hypothetical protein